MNSFAKFRTKFEAKAGPSQSAAGEKKASAPNATKKQEIVDRILTVDIKTMRKHMRDETNFNNPHTILEVFAKIHQISPLPQDSKMREYKLTLKTVRDTQPCYKMEADYYGNAIRSIQSGDEVRCVGRLIGQSGRFRVMKIFKIDAENEMPLINRLEAISSFQMSKFT